LTKTDNYYYQSNRSTKNKVVINILQGSVVTQTELGGLALYHPVANFLQCRPIHMCQKIIKIGWHYTKLLQQ